MNPGRTLSQNPTRSPRGGPRATTHAAARIDILESGTKLAQNCAKNCAATRWHRASAGLRATATQSHMRAPWPLQLAVALSAPGTVVPHTSPVFQHICLRGWAAALSGIHLTWPLERKSRHNVRLRRRAWRVSGAYNL